MGAQRRCARRGAAPPRARCHQHEALGARKGEPAPVRRPGSGRSGNVRDHAPGLAQHGCPRPVADRDLTPQRPQRELAGRREAYAAARVRDLHLGLIGCRARNCPAVRRPRRRETAEPLEVGGRAGRHGGQRERRDGRDRVARRVRDQQARPVGREHRRPERPRKRAHRGHRHAAQRAAVRRDHEAPATAAIAPECQRTALRSRGEPDLGVRAVEDGPPSPARAERVDLTRVLRRARAHEDDLPAGGMRSGRDGRARRSGRDGRGERDREQQQASAHQRVTTGG